MCWLTGLGDYDEDHKAQLFLKASLAGIGVASRVMHNFVRVGKDGKTPAMRLGLAKVPSTPEDVLDVLYLRK